MSQDLTFSVPTLFGVEGLTADELRRLGLDQVRAENGRVFCQGAALDLARLNLNLRTGERVLLVLGSFPAADFDALFEGTRALPWERFIPREGQFPVKGHSLNSALHSVPACQSIVKKAIAARLGAKYGLNTLPETGALYQVQFSIMGDEAVLMLDTSGAGLHKRGYRAQGVAAPLRETLAAAMVLLSRYRGRDPLCDPFCGSGTIPIEAALIAKNRAPGLNRTFSAQKWACVDKKLWLQAADEAMDKEFQGDYEIWGGDLDPAAVELARHNAALAEVDDVVRFDVDDARTFHWGGLYGRVVTNPPYGERIMERLGLTPDEVCCFGDAENDLAVLRHYENSVAVANAVPVVRECARYHIGPADEESVARALLDIAEATSSGRMPSFMCDNGDGFD